MVHPKNWSARTLSLVVTIIVALAALIIVVSGASAHRPYKHTWVAAEAKKEIRVQLCGAGSWRCLQVNNPPLVYRNAHSEQWGTLNHSSFQEGLHCLNLGWFGIQCTKVRWRDSSGWVSNHNAVVYALRRY